MTPSILFRYLPDATGVEKREIESFKWNIFMLWRNSASVLSNWRSKQFWIAFRNIGASCGRKSAPTRENESPKYIDWAKIDSIWPEQLNESSETRILLSCTVQPARWLNFQLLYERFPSSGQMIELYPKKYQSWAIPLCVAMPAQI